MPEGRPEDYLTILNQLGTPPPPSVGQRLGAFGLGAADAIVNAYGGRQNALGSFQAQEAEKRKSAIQNYLQSKNLGQTDIENQMRKEGEANRLAEGEKERAFRSGEAEKGRGAERSNLERRLAFEKEQGEAERASKERLAEMSATMGGKKTESEFNALPKEDQNIVGELAKKNAAKISITNQIDSTLANWNNLPEDQKVVQGRQLLKTLNSVEGADAIGTEEARRLGSKLEFVLIPRPSNQYQVGRDVEGFFRQAQDTSQAVKRAIVSNQLEINKRYANVGVARPAPGTVAEPAEQAAPKMAWTPDKDKRLEELRQKAKGGGKFQ